MTTRYRELTLVYRSRRLSTSAIDRLMFAVQAGTAGGFVLVK